MSTKDKPSGDWELSWQGPKGRSLRPEGPKRGLGFGEVQLASLHQLEGLGKRCKLSQWGPWRSPSRLVVLLYFRCFRWLLLHFRVHLEREQAL